MHYHGGMDNHYCCWNMKYRTDLGHNEDCNTLGPKWSEAVMVVTYTDGVVVRYPGVRFPVNTTAKDPTRVDGTTVVIETMDEAITLCGVRSFYLTF